MFTKIKIFLVISKYYKKNPDFSGFLNYCLICLTILRINLSTDSFTVVVCS